MQTPIRSIRPDLLPASPLASLDLDTLLDRCEGMTPDNTPWAGRHQYVQELLLRGWQGVRRAEVLRDIIKEKMAAKAAAEIPEFLPF